MISCSRLRADRLASHALIDGDNPEFDWIGISDVPGDGQFACEVEVSLTAQDGTWHICWSSGKLRRQAGEGIFYGGEPLISRESYRWRVRAWNRYDVVGPWSEWAFFGASVRSSDKWTASWISGGGAFRREFNVAPGLKRARAWVSGLGYYEAFCNEHKVSRAALAPSYTEFEKRVEYEVIDLESHLREGLNRFGILVANGWWNGFKGARELQAFVEIVLEYADGKREVIASGPEWEAADGPIQPSDPECQNFHGLSFDLGWLAGGWGLQGQWRSVSIVEMPGCRLVPGRVQAVTVAETRPAVMISRSGRCFRADFGQNLTGWVGFRAQGAHGDAFTIRHAELRHADGSLHPETLRGARQIDVIKLAGAAEGVEQAEPRLLYHGFRHADIEGAIDRIEEGSIVARVVHTDLPGISQITTSDSRINWLLDTLRWTVRGNTMSIMTDVCQRDERQGWLMDGITGFKAGMLFYDMNALGRKWLEDMIDNQEEDGSLRGDTAPVWFCSRSIGWQRAIVLLPCILYWTYGDISVLRRAYPHMRRYAAYLLANLKDDLLPERFSHHSAEWLGISAGIPQLADNAMAVDVLRKVAEAGRILGESNGLEKSASRIACAAHCKWFHKESAFYSGCQDQAQSSQVYALCYGLAPEEERARVFSTLLTDMMEAYGEGPFVTTGIGSTEHLPMVLSDFGRDDIVWRWLQRDTYPGYGFMHRNGATTIWERWEKRSGHQMNAHNHVGFSGIGTWLRERLLGIAVRPGPVPTFILRPGVHLPLERFQGDWGSCWGDVGVKWESIGDDRRGLTLSIPTGCIGHVKIPGIPPRNLEAGIHNMEVSVPRLIGA